MKILIESTRSFFSVFNIIAMCVAMVCVCGCVKSNDEKKEFIQKNQAKTNEKVAKKYGELTIPDFIKQGKYEFE